MDSGEWQNRLARQLELLRSKVPLERCRDVIQSAIPSSEDIQEILGINENDLRVFYRDPKDYLVGIK